MKVTTLLFVWKFVSGNIVLCCYDSGVHAEPEEISILEKTIHDLNVNSVYIEKYINK